MITNNERRLFDILDRALKLVCFWRERNQSQTAEVDSLKRQMSHFRNRTDYYRGRFMQACQTINAQRIEIAKSEIPYPKAASEVYDAQNELDLLRTIRRSQAERIIKLRQQLTEACTERDAASHRANAWRMDYNQMKQDRDVARSAAQATVKKLEDECQSHSDTNKRRDKDVAQAWQFANQCESERDVAREGLGQARSAVQALIKERDEMYQEMDQLRKDLDVSRAVNHIVARREANNPRLEMMLEESYRNEFKRNIDNQKATDAPNCPSS